MDIISTPGPSGLQLIPVSEASSDSDNDSDIPDDKKCCVCHKYQPDPDLVGQVDICGKHSISYHLCFFSHNKVGSVRHSHMQTLDTSHILPQAESCRTA